MSHVLERWNRLPTEEAATEILPCCGSRAWANGIAARRPFSGEATLLAVSDEIWRNLAEADWMEAFQNHPRIGESKTPQSAPNQSATWSKQEQQRVTTAGDAVKLALAEANREYERRFGRIFIVCATGKSGLEILELLRRRLENDKHSELREAAEQQRQITQIRLKRWLTS